MSRRNVSDIDDNVEAHFIPLENKVCHRCSVREPILLVVYGEEGHQFLCDICMDDDERDALQRGLQLLRDSADS